MAAPAPSTWPPTRYHAGPVFCPHRLTSASILAAAWKTQQHGWTRWYVVDCALLPAGLIACDMGCLEQVTQPITEINRH